MAVHRGKLRWRRIVFIFIQPVKPKRSGPFCAHGLLWKCCKKDANKTCQLISTTIGSPASGRLTDKWQVFAGYSYLDSEVVDPGAVGDRAGVVTSIVNHAAGRIAQFTASVHF
ncbi:hypothetical protein D6Z43_26315 [Pseudomonas sp. DY-1]|nr:hypothetical protein D6Z43_26315 [Pseudomonas sp. DY-1]